MSDEKALTSSEIKKRRAALFNEMTKETQELVTACHQKLLDAGRGFVILRYDIGAAAAKMVAAPDTYGTSAVEQMADYLSFPGGSPALYDCKRVADMFDRTFVKDMQEKPLSDGSFLSLGHWIALTKLKKAADREKMLAWAVKHTASAVDLNREIDAGSGGTTGNSARAGGRPPAAPTSPVAGLLKVSSLGKTFSNYVTTVEKAVFDEFDHMDADRINEQLLEKLEAAHEELTELEKNAKGALARVDTNLERVRRILDKRAETPAETDEPAPKAAKAPKSKGGAAGRAESNGKKKAKKKKRKAVTA